MAGRYLYKLTFPNDMVYIGLTGNPKSRWVGRYHGYPNEPMRSAIAEMGWDNIGKEILSENATICMERSTIASYGDKCYNLLNTDKWKTDRKLQGKQGGRPKGYLIGQNGIA